MKLSEIIVGETYRVQIPEDADRFVHEHAVRGEVVATVLEVGIHYDVISYSGSRIRGDRGYRRTQRSAYADGVRVRWERQEVPWRFARRGQRRTWVDGGEGIVRARSVKAKVEG